MTNEHESTNSPKPSSEARVHQQKTRPPEFGGITDGPTIVYLAFGDLRGWDTRLVLRLRAERPGQVPVVIDHGFAHALVGEHVVYGPVVLNDASQAGEQTIVIYLGRRIPSWATTTVPQQHRWQLSDNLPDQTNLDMQEVELLLITFGQRTRGWTRTVWLPYIPRPMQRIDLPLGDGEGPTVAVRVLEVGDDVIFDGETTPYVIVSCTQPPPSPAVLNDYKWAEEEWVAAKQSAWTGLDAMSDVVESHVAVLLGHAMVTHVALNPTGEMIDDVLPLLPRDVQIAIDSALADSEDGTGRSMPM